MRAGLRVVAGLGWLLTTLACSEEAPDPGPTKSTPGAAPPPLVLLVLDTLRADHLGLYGYGRETSPALDRLGAESVVFERCFAPSSWTQPSTTSLLTGLYPARHGAHEYAEVSDEAWFVSEALQEAGYATAAASGNPNASPLFRMDQGFDAFHFSGNDTAREYPDLTELLDIGDAWLEVQRADGGDSPWFLYLQLMNVHGPYRAPERYREQFLEEPWEPFPFQSEMWKAILRDGEITRRAEVTDAHLRDLTARYDGAIRYTDDVLGDWFERLEEDGVLDRAWLVVTADHGEELFEHGGFGHGFTLYPEVTHVPLIVRPPGGVKGGRRVASPVSLVDVAATLVDVAGVPSRDGAGRFGDGQSLLPLMKGEATVDDRVLLSEVRRAKQGRATATLRGGRQFIEITSDYAGRAGVRELYDLVDDPAAAHDLSGREPGVLQSRSDDARERQEVLEALALKSTRGALDPALQARLRELGYDIEPPPSDG